MNLLRRAQGRFRPGRDAAVAALREAEVVACDETGGRIEGSNAYHCSFRSAQVVVHTASPTRGAVVVHAMMDGHRPAAWISDRYTVQQGHVDEHQACLAQSGPRRRLRRRDRQRPDPLAPWPGNVFALAERVTDLATSTLPA